MSKPKDTLSRYAKTRRDLLATIRAARFDNDPARLQRARAHLADLRDVRYGREPEACPVDMRMERR